MQDSTIKKWKRDALEVEWDYKPEVDLRAREAVRQARRVMLLIEELISLRVMSKHK